MKSEDASALDAIYDQILAQIVTMISAPARWAVRA